MEILSPNLFVIRIEEGNKGTVPDKPCGIKALGVEANLHSVFYREGFACGSPPSVNLDIGNVSFRPVYIGNFRCNAGNKPFICGGSLAFYLDIGNKAVFTRNRKIGPAGNVLKGNNGFYNLELVCKGKHNVVSLTHSLNVPVYTLFVFRKPIRPFRKKLLYIRFYLARCYTFSLSVQADCSVFKVEQILALKFSLVNPGIKRVKED